MNIIENILNVTKKCGYNNKQICELLNKNYSYVSDWKKGKSKPKADEILLLAKEFNVSVDYLLGNKTDNYISDKNRLLSEELEELTESEFEDVKDYIEFLKSKRK